MQTFNFLSKTSRYSLPFIVAKKRTAPKNSKKEKGAFKKNGGQSAYQASKADVKKTRKPRSNPVDNKEIA